MTHFVDDRLDVLLNLKTVEHKYLFDSDARHSYASSVLLGIERVRGWDQVVEVIVGDSRNKTR